MDNRDKLNELINAFKSTLIINNNKLTIEQQTKMINWLILHIKQWQSIPTINHNDIIKILMQQNSAYKYLLDSEFRKIYRDYAQHNLTEIKTIFNTIETSNNSIQVKQQTYEEQIHKLTIKDEESQKIISKLKNKLDIEIQKTRNAIKEVENERKEKYKYKEENYNLMQKMNDLLLKNQA